MTEEINSLLPEIYEDLKQLARVQRSRVYSKNSMGTKSIIHEAYLNLLKNNKSIENKNHLFYLTSMAMRNIIVDNARVWSAKKRGGLQHDLTLDQVELISAKRSSDILALEQAMIELEKENNRLVKNVTCRFFGGLTLKETAQALNISVATAKRDWTLAKALLFLKLAA